VPADERHPAYLLATDEQRDVLNQIQALMAVVEGHGNFVMDTVGARVIPSFKRMRYVFERRREQSTTLQRILNQALGLEMKLRQYEVGQKFCQEVAAREGEAGFTYLWSAPEHLPTLDELKEPRRWLDRVA
jgi:putative hydrolase